MSAAGLAAALSESAASAAVPISLADATVKAALVFASGTTLTAGIISSSVLALSKGVQQAMFMNTLKVILAIGLAFAVVGSTGLAFLAMAYDSSKSEKEKENNTAQSKKGSKSDKEDSITKEISDRRKELDYLLNLHALLKERVEAAKTEVQARTREFEAGKGTLDFLIAASRRLLVAEWELSDKKEDQFAALKAHFDRMKAAEDLNQERFGAGRIAVQDLQQTKYYRLEAEIWLEKAKMGKFKLDVHSMP